MPTTLLTRHDSLTLAPELGASLVNWTRLSDDWPLLRHSDGQALAANTAHEALPIHGSAWQQTWQLVDATSDSATLQLDSLQPFPYRARLQATHLGERPTWYGLGLHPYLTRTAHTRLQAQASRVWLCNTDKLSTQLAELPAA
jgi:aldose 1-epimerase